MCYFNGYFGEVISWDWEHGIRIFETLGEVGAIKEFCERGD
jgi:hypothetical protein